MYLAFKLFNSIKHEHEAKSLARLELQGLLSQFSGVGPLAPIPNFADAAMSVPLKKFRKAKFTLPNPRQGEASEIAVLDCLLHELPYGRIHGYQVEIQNEADLSRLIRRLGYTREIYVVTESSNPAKTLRTLFPTAVEHVNAQFVSAEGSVLYRFITHQYFLEKSEYISKLSRNEEEVDRNVEDLCRFLTYKFYRIPASATMRVGKRLLDYFTIREEPSLYLTHYMHPYKGKFHPKMVRALLNYVLPQDRGLVLDNFAGSGTLLVEAVLMGLDAYGIEINPLSALMTHVKCQSLRAIKPTELAAAAQSYFDELQSEINTLTASAQGQRLIEQFAGKGEPRAMDEANRTRRAELAPFYKRLFKNGDPVAIDKFLTAQRLIETVGDASIRDFLLLTLSGAISDAVRRTKADILEILRHRFHHLYLRIYLFHKLNEVLQMQIGKATSFEGDTRDMHTLHVVQDMAGRRPKSEPRALTDDTIDAIVNSPPYSTALDYIKNDEPQLRILQLHESLERLKSQMMGYPSVNYDPRELSRQIAAKDEAFTSLPQNAQNIVRKLIDAGRREQGLRSYKFFLDMRDSLREMRRVVKTGGKCAIVIGNNHYRIDDTPLVVENDAILEEIATKLTFEKDPAVPRELEKSSTGAIREESILLLKKV
jgi:DNA modification methylase